MSNTPKIRFSGFTEDWEQRKLGDWGNFYYGRSCPKWSVTEDATIPCIRYGELYTKFGAKIDRVYSYTNMPPENLRFSKGTEVLIPRVGEDPMDYNHCTWLSMQDVAIGEMISVFNTDNNPLFTATMFNATLQNEFAMRVEGGSVTNLYFEKLKNIDVSFPSIPEQEKIAAYFENFDHLITLHQRKYDDTKLLKKYMLQKMFPQNGQKVPEIRFSGFTGDWEQRKLPEFVSFFNGLTYTPDDVEETGTLVLRSSNVKNGEIIDADNVYVNDKVATSENVQEGDIIVVVRNGSRALIGKHAQIKVSMPNTVIGAFMSGMRSEHSSFVNALLDTSAFENEIAKNMGATINQITGYMFSKMEFMIPSGEEQQQIGEYFQSLDNLITLHQRKCDELKELKKYMLQNMFPQKG